MESILVRKGVDEEVGQDAIETPDALSHGHHNSWVCSSGKPRGPRQRGNPQWVQSLTLQVHFTPISVCGKNMHTDLSVTVNTPQYKPYEQIQRRVCACLSRWNLWHEIFILKRPFESFKNPGIIPSSKDCSPHLKCYCIYQVNDKSKGWICSSFVVILL